MWVKIIVPVGKDVAQEDVIEISARHDVIAKRLNDTQYTFETEDPLNFFWLGMNFRAGVIKE